MIVYTENMEKQINYISDEVFNKLTKKQKLQLEQSYQIDEIEISQLVMIHTNKKTDGWSIGAFFAYTPTKGWWRPANYDCWKISTDINNPIKPRFSILKGDFQQHGIRIFGFAGENHSAYISCGGDIVIRNK